MPLRSVPTVIPRYTKLFLLPTKNWLLSFKGIENLFRLSRNDLQSYFKNSQKLNEIENYINALEPTGDPQRLQVALLRTRFIISRLGYVMLKLGSTFLGSNFETEIQSA